MKESKLSPFCKEDYRICKFVFFVTSMMDKKLEKDSLDKEISKLSQELHIEIFTEEEARKFGELNNYFRQEKYYYSYLAGNGSDQRQNQVLAFLYLNLVKVVAENLKTGDIFTKYMDLMEENLDSSYLSCQVEVIDLTDDFQWVFSYHSVQNKTNISLAWTDVVNLDGLVVKSCHLEREWNIDNTGRSCVYKKTEDWRDYWLRNCKKNQKSTLKSEYLKELLVLYNQLEYLEKSSNPTNAVQLMMGKIIVKTPTTRQHPINVIQ